MYPTVGRIVHFYAPDDGDNMPAPWAAIIVSVDEKPGGHAQEGHVCREGCVKVSLHVFHGQGEKRVPNAPWSSLPKRGHWNWPPRV
jgi:hypothetical protein